MLRVSRLQGLHILPKLWRSDDSSNNGGSNKAVLASDFTTKDLFSKLRTSATNILFYLMGITESVEGENDLQSDISINNNSQLSGNESFEKNLSRFKTLAEEIQALQSIWLLADWDMQTHAMPAKSGDYKAWQMSVLKKKSHEILISNDMFEIVEYLKNEQNYNKLSDIDKALVNEMNKQHDLYKKVPAELIQELSETTAKAHYAWVEAKETNNFGVFEPYLEKIISLKRKMAELVGYENSPYDVLLDQFEPGMTIVKLDKIFNDLKIELPPLIKAIANSPNKLDKSCLNKLIPEDVQLKIAKKVIEHIGFDFSRGRFGLSAHPFSTLMAPNDVGLTTAIYQDLWNTICTPIHEGGHGLYDLGISEDLSKTPLHDGASYGIHESQSRMYEAVVGQSLPFWKYLFPELQKEFPEYFKSITLEQFYKAINYVEPIFIRNQSDEVTYNMHVILRYEIEKDLIEGKLEVKDVAETWNRKMKEYLGIEPPTDTLGVLQDGHWSGGDVGYFPSYALGNLYSIQFYNIAKNQIPELEVEMEKGNMLPLKNWLNENIHKYGKMQTPDEIIQRVTGEPLNIQHFIKYIKEKYGKLYGIEFN